MLPKRKDLLDVHVEAHQTIKTIRKVSCLEMENAMFYWFTMMWECGATMTNDLLIVVAKKIYNMSQQEPSHKELQFSHAKVTY